MTEAEKVYYDDIREKKSIKNSASKTNRTGKGPIRFPSDYLSKKEKEAMNGECRKWTFSEFPDRQAFKMMPDDLKIGYINWILNVYNVGISTISKHVFNQGAGTFNNWLKANPEIAMYVNAPDRHVVIKPADVKRLIKDVERARSPKEPIEVKEPEVESVNNDFTPEEKDFISRYIAPISEPKEETAPSPEPEPESNSEPDISFVKATQISNLDINMTGFDMDLIDYFRNKFEGLNVRVSLRISVEDV